MNQTVKILSILLLFIVTNSMYGQTNQQKAILLSQDATKLINEGKPEKSIKLLEEAQKLDPEKFDYSYTLAYAHYVQHEYHRAIEVLIKIINHKDITDDYYQLLGNSYSNAGNNTKAVETFEEGLKRFPQAGNLYMELGNIQLTKKEYPKALQYFEKGIEVEPETPSAYYWASKIYCTSEDKIWGMIYGELFINIEKDPKRKAEISKLLFETYKNNITFKDKEAVATFTFCKEEPVNVNAKSDSTKYKLPYCMIYQPTLIMSTVSEKHIDLASLNKIRESFVKNYVDKKMNQYYPNILFEYQYKILQAGHMEAYNYWVLKDGSEEHFMKWKMKNKDKWESFEKWFADNRLLLDDTHKFFRGQY